MYEHKGRWYWMMGIDLAEYRNHMRRRSGEMGNGESGGGGFSLTCPTYRQLVMMLS